MAAVCEHGAESHDGTVPSVASAPEASRAWLLIEHQGPWPREAAQARLGPTLAALVGAAVGFGIRVQLIRRPGRRRPEAGRGMYVGWTAGQEPWLRRIELGDGPGVDGRQVHGAPGANRRRVGAGLDLAGLDEAGPDLAGLDVTGPDLAGLDVTGLDLAGLAAGREPNLGSAVGEPLFLVCTHTRRNACCARFGGPLAQALAARYPGQVFQTTHLGGHRFAANLAILPHGLYYGPVGIDEAMAAISAYQHGEVTPRRYRGRAGQPRPVQEAEHARLTQAGSLPVASLA